MCVFSVISLLFIMELLSSLTAHLWQTHHTTAFAVCGAPFFHVWIVAYHPQDLVGHVFLPDIIKMHIDMVGGVSDPPGHAVVFYYIHPSLN